MLTTIRLIRKSTPAAAAFAVLAGAAPFAGAQTVQPQSPVAATETRREPRIERLSGVWVEGPGFDITYGGTYDGCAQRCLATPACVMIEFYRPEMKCNMYNAKRPTKKGGSSDVGIRG